MILKKTQKQSWICPLMGARASKDQPLAPLLHRFSTKMTNFSI